MIPLTLHGTTWLASSPSRLQLAGYPCWLVFTPNGWEIHSPALDDGCPIPCPDRDTGAKWLAAALARPVQAIEPIGSDL